MPEGTKHGKRTASRGGSQGERRTERSAERKPATAEHAEESSVSERAEGAQDIVHGLVIQFGSEAEALRVLAGDNWDYRRKNKKLKEENEELHELVPGDDDVVLTGDDVKAWTAIKSLKGADGKEIDLAKVPDRLKRADELEVKLVGSERKATRDTAAQALKYNADVLGGLVEDPRNPLALELRDMVVKDASGKESNAKVPFVRKANDDKAAWEKLSDYAEREWKAWLPALKNVSNAQGGSDTSTSGTGGSDNGGSSQHFTPFVDQSGSPQGGGTDNVSKYIADVNARRGESRTNPLRAKPATTTQGTK